jgi:hypothetical protein
VGDVARFFFASFMRFLIMKKFYFKKMQAIGFFRIFGRRGILLEKLPIGFVQ